MIGHLSLVIPIHPGSCVSIVSGVAVQVTAFTFMASKG